MENKPYGLGRKFKGLLVTFSALVVIYFASHFLNIGDSMFQSFTEASIYAYGLFCASDAGITISSFFKGKRNEQAQISYH